jgi:hypothetical protein
MQRSLPPSLSLSFSLFLLLTSVSYGSTWSFVQGKKNLNCSESSSYCTIIFPKGVAGGTGDVVVVAIGTTKTTSMPINSATLGTSSFTLVPNTGCASQVSNYGFGADCAYVIAPEAGATSVTVYLSEAPEAQWYASIVEIQATGTAYYDSAGWSVQDSPSLSVTGPNLQINGNDAIIQSLRGNLPTAISEGYTSALGSWTTAFNTAYLLNTNTGTGPTWTLNSSGRAAMNGIAFTTTCGAPNYPCSSTSTANPGTISALFTSTASQPNECSGQCQNSTAYDTSINPSGIDCITRMSDGTVFLDGKSAGNVGPSGGDNDIVASKNTDYLMLNDSGGFGNLVQVSVSSGCMQVVNTGRPTNRIAKPYAFSRQTDNLLWVLAADLHTLQYYTITSVTTTLTPTTQFDFLASGNCPGIPTGFSPASASILGVSAADTRFAISLSEGDQNTAIWTLSYDTSLGCTAVNWETGRVWGWCLSSCSPTNPTPQSFVYTPNGSQNQDTCWGANPTDTGGGIHDMLTSYDGTYALITMNGSWTQGVCADSTSNNQFILWTIGTTTNQWVYDGNTELSGNPPYNGWFGSHSSIGETNAITPYYQGPNLRPMSDMFGGYTPFFGTATWEDIHQAWPHPLGDDSYPWVGATDSATPSMTCGTVYCPLYLENVIIGLYPNSAYPPGRTPTVFFHTYSCNPVATAYASGCPGGQDVYFGGGNAIGFVSQDGNWFCWGTSMLASLGLDDVGNYRDDAFCGHLQ